MSRPRLGFVGLGWIGAMRLDAVAASGAAEIAALCETDPDRLAEAGREHGGAEPFDDYHVLLDRAGELALDGVVIATPNAPHARQSIAALERGLAVFCQKPLGLDAGETRAVLDAARRADRLLAVDYSYRHTDGARALRQAIAAGELGGVFRIDSVFHNAYGPDKEWCRDPALAGGGALVDLGVHQIDLPLWLLDFPDVTAVRGTAFRDGRPLDEGVGIDDYAAVRLALVDDTVVSVDVSWNAHAGADCVYRVSVFGTEGGAELRNVDGSFYDFELARYVGRRSEIATRESRDWLGRGILAWVRRLGSDRGYDDDAPHSLAVAEAVDAVYRATPAPATAGTDA